MTWFNVSTLTLAEEVLALKRSTGIADRSGCGRLFITGADALDLLNRLSTQKLEALPEGHGTTTVITNGDGRVVDLIALGALDGGFWCITSPGHAQAVIDWLDAYTFGEDITVEDRTSTTFQLTLSGEAVEQVLALDVPPLDGLAREDLDGFDVVLWHRLSGGAAGFEIIGERSEMDDLAKELISHGSIAVTPEAWESHRIWNGMPAIDHEFGLFNNPLEARLLGAISDTKGCYTGQEVIARLQTYKKVQRVLMSVETTERLEPGAKLLADGKSVGEVTSFSETPDGLRGLALVASAHATDGAELATESGAAVVLRQPRYALLTEPTST